MKQVTNLYITQDIVKCNMTPSKDTNESSQRCHMTFNGNCAHLRSFWGLYQCIKTPLSRNITFCNMTPYESLGGVIFQTPIDRCQDITLAKFGHNRSSRSPETDNFRVTSRNRFFDRYRGWNLKIWLGESLHLEILSRMQKLLVDIFSQLGGVKRVSSPS